MSDLTMVFAPAMLILAAATAQTTPAPTLPPTQAATAGSPLLQKLVNQPQTAAWTVFGALQTSQAMPTGGPQNYPATRVTVKAKGAHPWDAGATSPIVKPIAAGDTVLVAVYLRAPMLKDGETAPISYLGLNETAAPGYAMVAQATAQVTNQWKLFYASGRTSKAYAAEGLAVGIHLAAARQMIDLGPVRVFDLGSGADPARLPKND